MGTVTQGTPQISIITYLQKQVPSDHVWITKSFKLLWQDPSLVRTLSYTQPRIACAPDTAE